PDVPGALEGPPPFERRAIPALDGRVLLDARAVESLRLRACPVGVAERVVPTMIHGASVRELPMRRSFPPPAATDGPAAHATAQVPPRFAPRIGGSGFQRDLVRSPGLPVIDSREIAPYGPGSAVPIKPTS